MHPLLNIAITAARQAGEIIIRNVSKVEHLQVSSKGNEGLFSEVDVRAEQAIINTILKAYPKHGILAEESGVLNEDAETIWIIDPLDGTTNYLHGFPSYCVSIAVQVKGVIEHGVILDPIRHECFMASRGRGARLNDHRIRVSKQTQLANALLGMGLSFRDAKRTQRYLPIFESLIGKCRGIRRTGSAALDLAYVACGRLDGLWEFGLNIWDLAAGVLLIQEAGGLISDMQGGEDYLNHGHIIATTPKIFKQLIQVLVPAAMKIDS